MANGHIPHGNDKEVGGTANTLGYRIRIPKALHIFLKGSENSFLMGINSRYYT